jgi:uncharacterized protein DUF4129
MVTADADGVAGGAATSRLRSPRGRVIVSGVAAALTWSLLAASVVIGLAGVVRTGRGSSGVDDIVTTLRLPEAVRAMVIALFALAALVLVIDGVRRVRWRRREDGALALASEAARVPPWMRALSRIAALVNVLVLVYLLWRGAIPLAGLLSLGQGLGTVSGPVSSPRASVDATPLMTWSFGGLALVAGLVALALALAVTFPERLSRWRERAPDASGDTSGAGHGDAVDAGGGDPRRESDARRAIVRCYARFVRAAAEGGIARQPWHTPLEFMRETRRHLAAARGAVPMLTALFELARFSDRALGPDDRGRALAAFDDIEAALAARRSDAATR